MATITVEEISFTGLEATYSAATAGPGDQVAAGDTTFLHVVNASVGDIVVTIDTPGNVEGMDIEDAVTTVTANEERFIGPLTRSLFGDPTDGNLATITYDDVTTVTVAAIKL